MSAPAPRLEPPPGVAPDSTEDLASTLYAVGTLLTRFVRFVSDHQARAVVLWISHTWALKAFEATPYLQVSSPEKQCGKTRLLELLEQLVCSPWRAVAPSEAVLFRRIERDCPTLLLDEVDALFGRAAGDRYEGHRALLNAGHRRGATVSRVEGEGSRRTLKDFSTFCAKALAGIGRLPDTVADRCIPIRLERRAPGERVERARRRELEAQAAPLRAELERWGKSVDLAALGAARPELPKALDDRAADGWEPLLAIADLAGGAWPEWGREAAVALHGSEEATDESARVQILADLRELFAQRGAERLSSQQLVDALKEMEERPWPEWRQGRPITPRQLASLLRPFGIEPRELRFADGSSRARGYERAALANAWRRYLGPPLSRNGAQSVTAGHGPAATTYDDKPAPAVTDRESPNPLSAYRVTNATGREHETGEAGLWEDV